MDAANSAATTVEEYLNGTPNFRTDLYSTCGTLVTHAESIEIIDGYDRNFTPELKSPSVEMPFEGDYTQEDYQSITDVTDNDGVTLELLDVLAQDVGVLGVFSDWPATTTFYANCMGL